jgi:transposase-like protein
MASQKVLPDSMVYTDGFQVYDVLNDSEIHHQRGNHSKVFVSKRSQPINGIEKFEIRRSAICGASMASQRLILLVPKRI